MPVCRMHPIAALFLDSWLACAPPWYAPTRLQPPAPVKSSPLPGRDLNLVIPWDAYEVPFKVQESSNG
jgi:hypothetical protein